MTQSKPYLKVLLLASVSLLSGIVLHHFAQFSYLFFDANIFDISLLAFVFMLPVVVHFWYPFLDRVPLLPTLLVAVMLAGMNYWIKEVILRFPTVLNLVVYVQLIMLGLSLALVGKHVGISRKWLKPMLATVLVVVGVFLGHYAFSARWLTGFAFLSLVVIFLTFNGRRHFSRVALFTSLAASLVIGFSITPDEKVYASQVKFHDKVVFSTKTPFQQIDVTAWKGNRWYYFNGTNQFSTLDEWMYYEPMVHPVMQMADAKRQILVLGGENGIIARELKKYEEVAQVDILPLDTTFYQLSKKHDMFKDINQNALNYPAVTRLGGDPFRHLHASEALYDVMIIDLPDPVDLELNQYYTHEFYQLCRKALKPDGFLVTQSGSPYYATKAFYAIGKTLESAGFHVLPLHNQVISLGEWGWMMGSATITTLEMRKKCEDIKLDDMNTRWLNREAMKMMMSFGKPYKITGSIDINTLKNPVIHEYYNAGTWKFE
ncbi:MAG: hypothetical protein RIG77_05215 [Cyclobacteriaceae bacterium]